MKLRIPIYVMAFMSIMFLSCKNPVKYNYIYPKDSKVSNAKGFPADSLTFYFPEQIRIRDTIVKIGIDSLSQNEYASFLYREHEPVLYNYYLKHAIYRFIWDRSLAYHSPVIISIHRDKDSVWLITKMFDRHRDNKSRSVSNRLSNIIVDEMKKISLEEWDEFEQLLEECDYWKMPPTEKLSGLECDGDYWTIEGHLIDRYWFVNRWSPKGKYKACGEYLLKLSGLNNEIH